MKILHVVVMGHLFCMAAFCAGADREQRSSVSVIPQSPELRDLLEELDAAFWKLNSTQTTEGYCTILRTDVLPIIQAIPTARPTTFEDLFDFQSASCSFALLQQNVFQIPMYQTPDLYEAFCVADRRMNLILRRHLIQEPTV